MEQRFWAKVTVSDPTSCWTWAASKNRDGYGWFRIGAQNKLAHRVSWVLHNGEIPGGLWVLHRCDNPSCVNPTHLFLGDVQANVDDSIEKGRRSHLVISPKCRHAGTNHWTRQHPERRLVGERNPNSKLNDDQVGQIRTALERGDSQRTIAERFNISQQTVSTIATGLRGRRS